MNLATSHYISILWLKREPLIGAPVFDSRSICLIVIGVWLSWMWLTKSSNLVGKLLPDPIFVSMTLAVPSTSTHRDQGPLNTTGCVKVRAKNLIYRCCRFARDCAAWSRCIHMHCHHRGVIPLKYLLRVQRINLLRRQMDLFETVSPPLDRPQIGVFKGGWRPHWTFHRQQSAKIQRFKLLWIRARQDQFNPGYCLEIQRQD